MPNEGMNAQGPDIDEYETPDWLYQTLDTEFGFTLDPCASETTYKCKRFYTRKEDGIIQSWQGERIFMNPPYSDYEPKCVDDCSKVRCGKRGWHRTEVNPGLDAWVGKATSEWGYKFEKAALIVLLLPARTAAPWFEVLRRCSEIRFYRKRIPFLLNGEALKSPRFDSMLAILRGPRL